MNFTPNFVGKLRSSSLAKFASFDVVGLVIQLQNNAFKQSENISQPSKAYFMMFTSET